MAATIQKADQKYFIILQKVTEESTMTFDKGRIISKWQKKYCFSHETGLVLVHSNVFKDWSRNPATFKMELFAAIANGKAYNQWTVIFVCCCDNLMILKGKIKIGWKWPCHEGGIRYAFLSCRHVFTFFQKHQLLSVSLTFCFILKINYKNENWYHCWFHLLGFY